MALKKAYPQRRMNPILYLIFLSPRQGFRVAEWHSGARCATALSLLALSTSPHNVAPTVRRTREGGARQWWTLWAIALCSFLFRGGSGEIFPLFIFKFPREKTLQHFYLREKRAVLGCACNTVSTYMHLQCFQQPMLFLIGLYWYLLCSKRAAGLTLFWGQVCCLHLTCVRHKQQEFT